MKRGWGRWIVAILVASVVLSTGCSRDSSERLVRTGQGDVSPLASGQPAPSQGEPESTSAAPQLRDTATPPGPTPRSVEGLVLCEDVPELGSRVEGNLGSGLNVDDDTMDVFLDYRREHQENHGGLWIDRDNGGTIVLAVTDDPEVHRQELQDRLAGLDAVFDVIQVEYTNAELADIREILGSFMGREFGLLVMATSESQNRVSLEFYDPPEGALKMFAELVDPDAICVTVTRSPELPDGPLALIPDLEAEDPLVTCAGIPPLPFSKLSNPVPIDDVDHPAVEALRTLVQQRGVWELPDGDWQVINIDEDHAKFAASTPEGFGTAVFERTSRDNWIIVGSGTGPPCESVVVLPEGLNRVAIRLGSIPSPEDTAIRLLVTEESCASGREMGDALLGPQVIETDDAVLVAFAAVSPIGPANCPGNPSTPVTIELSQPLGRRTLYDGLHVPPKPLTAE